MRSERKSSVSRRPIVSSPPDWHSANCHWIRDLPTSKRCDLGSFALVHPPGTNCPTGNQGGRFCHLRKPVWLAEPAYSSGMVHEVRKPRRSEKVAGMYEFVTKRNLARHSETVNVDGVHLKPCAHSAASIMPYGSIVIQRVEPPELFDGCPAVSRR